IFGCPVLAPPPGEYVADGAARQAAWVLRGGEQPPEWSTGDIERYESPAVPSIRERHAEERDPIIHRPSQAAQDRSPLGRGAGSARVIRVLITAAQRWRRHGNASPRRVAVQS